MRNERYRQLSSVTMRLVIVTLCSYRRRIIHTGLLEPTTLRYTRGEEIQEIEKKEKDFDKLEKYESEAERSKKVERRKIRAIIRNDQQVLQEAMVF